MQDGLTNSACSFSSAGYPISETLRRPSAPPHPHVENNSGHHLHPWNRQRGKDLPVQVGHSQRRSNVQAPSRPPLYPLDLDRPSLPQVVEATHNSLSPPPTNNNSAPVFPIRGHRGSEPTLSCPDYHLRQSTPSAQPPKTIQSEIVSFCEAERADRATFDTRSFPVHDLQYPNQAVNAPRFV